jgi:hypothetical protein
MASRVLKKHHMYGGPNNAKDAPAHGHNQNLKGPPQQHGGNTSGEHKRGDSLHLNGFPEK